MTQGNSSYHSSVWLFGLEVCQMFTMVKVVVCYPCLSGFIVPLGGGENNELSQMSCLAYIQIMLDNNSKPRRLLFIFVWICYIFWTDVNHMHGLLPTSLTCANRHIRFYWVVVKTCKGTIQLCSSLQCY